MSVTFDDNTLPPTGGLTVAALLAQKLDVTDLVDAHLRINGEAGANGGAKYGKPLVSGGLWGRQVSNLRPRL